MKIIYPAERDIRIKEGFCFCFREKAHIARYYTKQRRDEAIDCLSWFLWPARKVRKSMKSKMLKFMLRYLTRSRSIRQRGINQNLIKISRSKIPKNQKQPVI